MYLARTGYETITSNEKLICQRKWKKTGINLTFAVMVSTHCREDRGATFSAISSSHFAASLGSRSHFVSSKDLSMCYFRLIAKKDC